MSRRRVLRRRALAIAVILALLVVGYAFWLRDSSLFAVEEVEVTGVTANKAEVTEALTEAGREMTTLHVRDDELAESVRGFPTVASISADSSLLHRLEVRVTERLPVAKAKIDGEALPVSADGYVLIGLDADLGELPAIDPASRQGVRVDEEAAAQAAILGGVPPDLAEGVRSATWDETRGGVVVELDGAPELRFGDGERAEEKWESLAAVLAAGGLSEASYVDVSVPERPVIG